MSESETNNHATSTKPYLIVAAILVAIVVLVVLWPTLQPKDPKVEQPSLANDPVPIEQAAQNDAEQAFQEDTVRPELFEATPEPQSVVLETKDEIEPIEITDDSAPDPIVDESDGAIKRALIDMATSEMVASLLVNESLLQNFVVTIYNMANQEGSPNHSVLTPPQNSFRIYQQADREWIDPASFQRYSLYVEALESIPLDKMMSLFETYRPAMEEKFSEISMPNESLDSTLIRAIDELLDTPKVPVPIEVYSDSVMYKYKDEKIENLSAPQKQLLRTGPENMRRIKQVLRDIKSELQRN